MCNEFLFKNKNHSHYRPFTFWRLMIALALPQCNSNSFFCLLRQTVETLTNLYSFVVVDVDDFCVGLFEFLKIIVESFQHVWNILYIFIICMCKQMDLFLRFIVSGYRFSNFFFAVVVSFR